MPHIRPYRASDWEAFLTLDLETGLVGEEVTEAERAAYVARWPRVLAEQHGFADGGPPPPEHGDLFVLEDEQSYAGHVWVREQPDLFTGKARLFVVTIAVAAAQRGRGLGKLLMAHVEQEARRRGLDEITLGVTAANTTALGLYQQLGYRVARHTLRKPLSE